jgi:hypothetical protein
LQLQVRDQQREIDRLKLKLAQGAGGGADEKVTEIDGLRVLVRKSRTLAAMDGANSRTLSRAG